MANPDILKNSSMLQIVKNLVYVLFLPAQSSLQDAVLFRDLFAGSETLPGPLRAISATQFTGGRGCR